MDYEIQTIDYYSSDNLALYNEISLLTQPINATYSKHSTWLKEKFFPGLKDGSRKMVIALDEKKQLAGVALLKDTAEEKKLCCLFVRKDCRGYGIASSLMQKTFQLLKTNKPVVSVSDKNYPQLKKLLEINEFKFSYRKNGAYEKDTTEYYFNNEATEVLKEKILAPLFAKATHNSR